MALELDQPISQLLLEHPMIKALCLITRELLAEAAKIFTGSIQDEKVVGTFAEKDDGRVSRVMEEVFHVEGDENANDVGGGARQ